MSELLNLSKELPFTDFFLIPQEGKKRGKNYSNVRDKVCFGSKCVMNLKVT